MMFYLYSALGLLAPPLVRPWLNRRAKRGKEDAARMHERFGRSTTPRPAGKLVWLHAASVGETQSVLILVRRLLEADAALHILITTGTVTSAALVAQQNLPRTIHQFVPVDLPMPVKHFLNHWKPDLALWVESEFWPQLLVQAKARGTRLLLVNARMSEKSYQSWRAWPRSILQVLQCFDTIFAGTPEDAERLRALGATTVVEAGNLKYDAATLPVDAALTAMLRAQAPRPFWVAASTHANEEEMVAHAHQRISQRLPDLLTLLVPRHANRGQDIAQQLRSMGLEVAQRSAGEPITAQTHIYLADTMGELGSFYDAADVVFLGGSLVPHGGHNPLEPARQHCAILSGRHMHNFVSIATQMQAQRALYAVEDTDELATEVERMLRHPEQARAMGERAYLAVQEARGASDAILQRAMALLA
ncbi:MAG: 3-deoxy-D-manno-octulosonic acid transferase [Azospirillum brasilense]|nr:MAG: 3-deoxy-D-manno-octulosonic acid transferase [Azospirillum brasilense]